MSVASCLAAQFQTFYDIICQVNKRTDNRKLQLQIFHNKKPVLISDWLPAIINKNTTLGARGFQR